MESQHARSARSCGRSQLSPVPDAFGMLAARIRTGSVYEEQPSDTFGLLVTRCDPRTRRSTAHGRHQVRTPIHAHWPLFAPSVRLLTGHETACLARRCHGTGSHQAHAVIHLGWYALATAYQAELADWPTHTRLAVARQVMLWLHEHETVTILSFERRMPADGTPGWWAQRHVFREWLCSLLPLAMPPRVALASA